MHITNYTKGHRYAPLEELEVTGATGGTLIISDGVRRVYERVRAESPVRFTIGGATGLHTILHINAENKLVERVYFRVEATTTISDAGGEFGELLAMLSATMLGDSDMGFVRWNKRMYHVLAFWLRDHVRVLDGMKYVHADLQSGLDLYRASQRQDGMIRETLGPRSASGFDMTDLASSESSRISVVADTESLFVEGVYSTWQATGDDGWMEASLDAAVRALDSVVNSPYRWSQKFNLIKRGYTIDMRDVQSDEDSAITGDPAQIDPEHTRFGIVFGDNTSYSAACRMLATLLDHAGRSSEATRFRERADAMQQRLDEVSWNGEFFIHHVPEEYGLIRELGVDEDSQLALSNASSLNRGIRQEQAAAILRTYQELRNSLPPGAPAEWYTIFPPFARGFGAYSEVWQSVNGGVTPVVAGELARGAFAHGFEAYGVDILRRLLALGHEHGERIHGVYSGAFPETLAAASTPSDQPVALPTSSISYGIDSAWAAAATMSALVEGLAGVIDQTSTFEHAVVAPRWLAADVDEAEATIAYPASGGYVAYRYNHDRANRQIQLTITGGGTQATCRVLLPPYAQRVQVFVNNAEAQNARSTTEQSSYVEFRIRLPGPVVAVINY